MDIVVQLGDGSIANVEVQRIGYAFPGQRGACYSADLLLRQYKRVKGEKGKKFSYRDIKKVYTIVFYEKSTKEFHEFEDIYIHHSQQETDTGLKIDLFPRAMSQADMLACPFGECHEGQIPCCRATGYLTAGI